MAISMMLMGITIFLMVFVPMGFQFLAVLGGKAFLMSKLALLLASVNGLKRVSISTTSRIFCGKKKGIFINFVFYRLKHIKY